MQYKLKEIISKCEHLAELFVEREGAANFLKWAWIPRRIFFLKRARMPRSWEFFKEFSFCWVVLFRALRMVQQRHIFRGKISGHDFWREVNFFKHINSYSPFYSILSVPFRKFYQWHGNQGGHRIRGGNRIRGGHENREIWYSQCWNKCCCK